MAKIHKLEDRVVLDGAALDSAETLSTEFLERLSQTVSDTLESASAAAPLEALADSLGHTAVAPMDEKVGAVAEALSTSSAEAGITVTLVSNDLPGFEILTAMQGPAHRVVVVDAHRVDSAKLIGDLVAELQGKGQRLAALNVMTHGGGGYFALGQDTITADSLDGSAWSSLSSVLVESGRINLYGCNLVDGSGSGVDLLNSLSQATGADVFGSNDLTGVGGDWDLEVASDGAVLVEQIDAPLIHAALTQWKVTMAGPTGVDTLVWLRADTGVYQDAQDGTEASTSGDDVRFWEDQSGNDHHVKIGDGLGGGDPTITESAIGGQSAVTFDGNDRLQFVDADGNESDLVLPGTGWTLFLVWETTDGTNAVVQYQLGGVDQGILTSGTAFQTKWGLIGDDASENNLANGAAPSGDTYATFYQHAIYEEGSLIDSYNTEGSDVSTDITLDSVGGRADFVNFGHVGHIAEVIIYDHELNAGERTLVEDYLNTRYGFNSGDNEFTLDTSEGVDQDVTGIGRDAANFSDWDGATHTGLDNPNDAHQASSAGVTITGSADDTAAEASVTELDIGEAVFLGHDGADLGQTEASGAIQSAGIEAYLSRSWGIEKSAGTAAQITIAFDLSATSGTDITEAGTGSNYELLYRASAGDDWTVVSLADGDPDTAGDTVTFTVADGELADGLYTLGTRSVADSALGNFNAAPVINNLDGDALGFTEDTDTSAIVLDQSTAVTLTDSDGGDFNGGSLTVSVSSGGVAAQDVLAIRDQGAGASHITVSGSSVFYGGVEIGTFTGGSGGTALEITFNGNSNATSVSALLANVTYFNTETDEPTAGARVIDFTMDDGDGGISGTAQVTVTVSATNDAPTSSATGNTDTYIENASAVQIANTDFAIDTVEAGQTIESLVFTINNLEDPDSERLSFDGSTITLTNGGAGTTTGNSYIYSVSTSGGTATITFSKAGVSVAATETLVKAATYDYAGEDPVEGSAREVRVQVQDSGGGSDTSTALLVNQISISAQNDDPTGTGAPTDVSFTEDVQGNLDLSALNLGDVDDASLNVTLTVGQGVLNASSGSGVTVTGGGTGTMRFTGSTADLNSYFDQTSNVQYQGASNEFGDNITTLTVHADDGESGNVLLATVNVDISAVNDAPEIAINSGLTLDAGTDSVITRDMLRVTDTEQGASVLTLTLTGVPSQGQLLLNGLPLSIGDSLTQQDIDSGNLTYQTNAVDAGVDSFRFTGIDGQGGALLEQAFAITVNAVHEAGSGGDQGAQTPGENTGAAVESDIQPGVIIESQDNSVVGVSTTGSESDTFGRNIGLAETDPSRSSTEGGAPIDSLDLGVSVVLPETPVLDPGSASDGLGDIATAAGGQDRSGGSSLGGISRFASTDEEDDIFASVTPETVGSEIGTSSLGEPSLRGDFVGEGEESPAELFVDDQSETFGARARELVDLFEESHQAATRAGVDSVRGAATDIRQSDSGLLRVSDGGAEVQDLDAEAKQSEQEGTKGPEIRKA